MSDPDGKEYTDAAVGVGAVDAVFKAIERIVGTKFVLDNFTVQVCALPCLALPCLALPCLALRRGEWHGRAIYLLRWVWVWVGFVFGWVRFGGALELSRSILISMWMAWIALHSCLRLCVRVVRV